MKRPSRRRWWVLSGAVLWAACGVSLPAPIGDGCRSPQQCARGLTCVAGRCVTVNHDSGGFEIIPRTDAGPTSGSDGACGCTVDQECSFAGPCVMAVCEQGCCVAKALPSGTTCTVGNACPAPGRCSLGLCTATGPPCDDGESCSLDACTASGCTHVPFADGEPCAGDGLSCTIDTCDLGHCVGLLEADACLIDGICRGAGEVDPEHPCNVCLPNSFQEGWTGRTSGACDDRDACTTQTVCTDSSGCVGKLVACDDDNACTDDSCVAEAGCVHLSNHATCTDADPCAVDGTCKDGKCVATGLADCSDGNPCTADSCVEGFGCIHKPRDGGCLADTDPCTDDVCSQGKCIAVPSVSVCKIGGTCVGAGDIAAGNPCKICSPELESKAWTVLDGAQCDDGNPCTSFDACTKGACHGEATACDDGATCTADSCEKAKGCVHTPVDKACDDGSKCTTGDKCSSGACGGTPVAPGDCSDGNPCTIDECVPAYGCSSRPATMPCNDGDKCTKGDICVAGHCTAGQIVCPCEFDSDCVDLNPCTTDECVLGVGCKNKPLPEGSTCDDGDKCTVLDLCGPGGCKGQKLGCDDNNDCTKDGCVAEAGCMHQALGDPGCDDGDKCTIGDLCVSGVCTGTPKNCDDGNDCSVDACDGMSAQCAHTPAPEGSVCPDDNIPCTIDVCRKGTCSHSGIGDSFCLIQGACLSGGALHPAQQCWGCRPLVHNTGWTVLVGSSCKDGDSCTVSERCSASGKCAGKPADCDDGNVCTNDACNPQAPGGDGCIHSPLAGQCDDGDVCTQGDGCKEGLCVGAAIDCSDANPCTVNGCKADKGCFSTDLQDGTPCPDDQLACTRDRCAKGQCRHDPKPGYCAIGASCYEDGAASPQSRCIGCVATLSALGWSPRDGAACDDGNPCTGTDACQGGACTGDPTKACDDGNPCTLDSCGKVKGCAHSATPGSCEDGDLCTTGDACKNGTCVGGNVVQCKPVADGSKCRITVCLPDQGCTNETRCGPLHRCSKGLCLTGDANTLGPVKVAVPPGIATQPKRPTIRWQESGTGSFGAVPRLWIAAQTRGCSPALGTWSGIFSVLLSPAAKTPAFRRLKTPSPTGTASWCAIHPVLAAHPTTYDALVLGWIEGGAAGSPCPISGSGGQLRVGLVGLNAAEIAMSVGAKCPAGKGTQPIAARPAMVLLNAGPLSNKQDPAQLSGFVARPTAVGTRWWSGNVVGGWGAASGKGLPPAPLAGHTEQPLVARPVLSRWTTGEVLLVPTGYRNPSGAHLPALTAVRIDASGVPGLKRNVVLTGINLAGSSPTYRAVEADYDPDIKRIGVLISGTVETSGSRRGFLAFARVHPEQAPVGSPHVAVVHDVLKVIGGQATISAFRVAEIPGSADFLAAWAAPNTAIIKAFRIEVADDSSFKAVNLGSLTGTYAGQTAGTTVVSSGGLSELLIAPDGQRFSLAWEGVGDLYLLTAAIPK